MICILLMETAMIGVFCSLDFILFYVFWEAMLIPMYLLIAVWGGPQTDYASIKFFIYTLFGSVFLLVAIIALYLVNGTFSIPEAMFKNYPFNFQALGLSGLCHRLCHQSAHVSFPYLVAGGPYGSADGGQRVSGQHSPEDGHLRVHEVLPSHHPGGEFLFCPLHDRCPFRHRHYLRGFRLPEPDRHEEADRLFERGPHGICHPGDIHLYQLGFEGAMLQMLNHGDHHGRAFSLVGIVYERTHSREIYDNAGLGKIMPVYVGFFGLFAISSFGFPGTNSFVGELYVLVSTFARSKTAGFLAVVGAVLAAAYMLRLLKQIVWGREDKRDEQGHERPGVDLPVAAGCFRDLGGPFPPAPCPDDGKYARSSALAIEVIFPIKGVGL